MPVDNKLYPPGWDQFSEWVRHVRAQDRCECTGQCGLHRPRERTPLQAPPPSFAGHRCREINHTPAKWAKGKVWLCTAHLCDCYPLCKNPAHVLAMCQRCHLRLDRFRHAAARLRTQAAPGYKSRRYRRTEAEVIETALARISLTSHSR